ncbi:MAG: alanine--tRNA ligase, partial [Gammaproteobacteria bacterium]|nr:alanine--tRNA ligase [Gammaproteobacteria bacterium]
LERMATVLQGVHSNFEIDLFAGLMRRAGEIAGIRGRAAVLANPSLRVIADHLRSGAFLIADGVAPGNEDRAYVLRRIIRRGLRHGYKLKIQEPFFHQLVDDLAAEMGEAYPLLVEKLADIKRTLLAEEERFADTLSQGMELLEGTLAGQDDDCIPGEVLFKLYDTYGFPTDLTADIARERGLAVDMPGFEAEMERQRERGRASARFDFALGQKVRVDSKVDFLGYDGCAGQGKVVALFDPAGDAVEFIGEGAEGIAVLDQTPFYAESGGQVGDTGALGNGGIRFEVSDTITAGEQHLHIGKMAQGELRVGDPVAAEVDAERRRLIRANHSATHLLHAALRRVLGDHVQQRGSLVDAERLRFDFSHGQPVSDAEVEAIERLVNDQIQANSEVATRHMSYPEAIESGAVALFGEKYGDQVRVLAMGGDYSVELCGGTHVARTGDMGLCKVTSESGIAAGVRRIEAVTGNAALARMADAERRLSQLAEALKTTPLDLHERLLAVLDENQTLKKSLRDATDRMARDEGSGLAEEAADVNGIKVVAAEAPGDAKAMMKTLDLLKSQLDRYVIVLGQANGGKVSLVAALSADLTDVFQAPELVNAIGVEVGARGGGRAELARAGGGDQVDRLAGALAGVADWVRERVA